MNDGRAIHGSNTGIKNEHRTKSLDHVLEIDNLQQLNEGWIDYSMNAQDSAEVLSTRVAFLSMETLDKLLCLSTQINSFSP